MAADAPIPTPVYLQFGVGGVPAFLPLRFVVACTANVGYLLPEDSLLVFLKSPLSVSLWRRFSVSFCFPSRLVAARIAHRMSSLAASLTSDS